MNSTVKQMQARANANPNRAAMLAKRREVLAAYGDPEQISRDAREQALRLRRLTK